MPPSCQHRAILLIPAGQPSAFFFSCLREVRSAGYTELLWAAPQTPLSSLALALQKSLGACACSGRSFPLQIPWNETAWEDMEYQQLAETAAAQIKPVLGYHTVSTGH